MAGDVDALENLLDLFIELASDIKEAKSDGEIDWRDLPTFADLLPQALKAVKELPEAAKELGALGDDADALKSLLEKAVEAVVALTEAVVASAA